MSRKLYVINARLYRALIDWYSYSGTQPQDMSVTMKRRDAERELRLALAEWLKA